ncbi:MAG: tRNA (adenosine(37)-N6)-threonylcarbamoyltransferase complex dimerization subunit type 1 TsaB [Alphaproteobacteria bacterium]|nr:tRNA (adenosine(37)-N6)-threonylcarbamoyltransferase complex dimerization subunit type 1 TsaB [Alphaproteobacteria bacterium]
MTTTILAFDTSLSGCSAALWRAGALVAERMEELDRGHAEALIPMIEELRHECGFEYGQVDILAVTIGPGTFAGIRVGLAAARAMALVLDRPVIGVGTLAALAATARKGTSSGDPVATIATIDARHDQIYWQLLSSAGRPLTEPALTSLATVAAAVGKGPFQLCGSGAAPLDRLLAARGIATVTVQPTVYYPRAAVVAAMAAELSADGLERFRTMPRPLYLRPPDAKLPGGVT